MKRDDGLSMKVQFTQEITVIPPQSINDRVTAFEWFDQDPEMRLRDAIDVRQGEVEVLEMSGGYDQ